MPFCFGADWAVRAVMKNCLVLQKYPTFGGVSSIFSWAKQTKK